MNVYIAAPWAERDRAREAGELVEAAGHYITRKWWDHEAASGQHASEVDETHAQLLKEQAREDMFGVVTADALIVLNLSKSEGKAVETGIALMSDGLHHLVLVGPRTNIFHYLPCWDIVETIEEAIEALNG